MSRKPRVLFVLLASAGLASGCATFERGKAMDTERELAAAGFQIRMADTPEKLAELQGLPQRQIGPISRDGRTFFVYADAKFCKCLYAGTERAYDRYERIALVKGLVVRRQETADAFRDATLDLGAWGPWYPWR